MNKWALIFDEKFETCECCPVFKHGYCKKEQKWITGGGTECPDWCPLKELPPELKIDDIDITETFAKGYNACLKEITED